MNDIIKSHSNKQTLDEWLSYLESLHFTEIDLGLARISKVAERLAINFSASSVITVAGTNGKGTTCAFIENALVDLGKSVAVYSSPHIEKFNERLRINKVDITDSPLIKAFEQIEAVRKDISLTYYEYTTLAAFLILMEQKTDFIILEVGLGGRLDATNIIDADVAVVTSVDLDHQAFLGDTREKIGFEKAGIMRANKVAIVGDINVPESVVRHANAIGANLSLRDKSFSVEELADGKWQWQMQNTILQDLLSPFIPKQNVATALAVLSSVAIELTSENVNRWIKHTQVPGRTELLQDKSKCHVLLDVGHNPHATQYLAKQVKCLVAEHKYPKVHAVLGMLADKDIENSIKPLVSIVDNWYFSSLDVPRGAKASELKQQFAQQNNLLFGHCFDSVVSAYQEAIKIAEPSDLILVFGSFYTVADVRKLLI